MDETKKQRKSQYDSDKEDSDEASRRREKREKKKQAGLERGDSSNDIELRKTERSTSKRALETERSSSKSNLQPERASSKRDLEPERSSSKKDLNVASKKDDSLEKSSTSRRESTLEKSSSKRDVEDSGKKHHHHHHHHEKRKEKSRTSSGKERGIEKKKEKTVTIYTPSRLSMDTRPNSTKAQAHKPVLADLSSITRVEDPTISVEKKIDDSTGESGLLVKLRCSTDYAQIYYTFNNVAPNSNSFKYSMSGPFMVNESTKLNVVAMIRSKKLSSTVVSQELVV